VTLFWVVLAAIYATQVALVTPGREANALRQQLTWQMIYYVAWAPITLLIWRVTRHWEIDRLGWARFLVQHVVLAIVIGVAQVALAFGLSMVLAPLPRANESTGQMIWFYLRSRVHMQVLIYAAVVGTGQAIGFYKESRERQLTAARLEAQLAAARLDTLRAQLQPHFLFNSLHSIAALARAGDTAGVVRLISGFSDLLRHLLDSSVTHHSLRDELDLVERYLDIQRVRFGDRLRVTIETAPEVAAARVPLLIVQPLVENALRHGFAPRIEPGHLAVRAGREGASLVIRVEDDGVGLPPGWSLGQGPGTGLRNLSSRLEGEFGREQTLLVERRPEGGVSVTIRLPYRRS
jgi:LytS/YehU family sensor histidine kinase